jgi:hypothetical protein
MITLRDLEGMSSWGVGVVALLTLFAFFPILVLVGVGAMWLITMWRTYQ